MEQKAAGVRRLQPRSDPVASHVWPLATATAEPPEEPPQVMAVFHGLTVLPNTSLKVLAPCPNSGVLAFATTIPPLDSRVSTIASEPSGTLSANSCEPYVVRTPDTSLRSLTAIGIPPSQPR